MRPAKRILLIDTDPGRQAVRRYVLHTHSFYIASADSKSEALRQFCVGHFDIVLCAWPLKDINVSKLLKELDAIASYIPKVVLAETLSGREPLESGLCQWLRQRYGLAGAYATLYGNRRRI
jgi:DNA-binding response OmpR family regulator